MPEDRITDLEIRMAHQDRTISALDDVVLQLRTELERMQLELARVKSRVDGEGVNYGPANERPPHY